jgi:hypothetical protein
LSSWRLTTSGSVLANQERRLSSRLLMLLMLNVEILNRPLAAAALPAAYQKDHCVRWFRTEIVTERPARPAKGPIYKSNRSLRGRTEFLLIPRLQTSIHRLRFTGVCGDTKVARTPESCSQPWIRFQLTSEEVAPSNFSFVGVIFVHSCETGFSEIRSQMPTDKLGSEPRRKKLPD